MHCSCEGVMLELQSAQGRHELLFTGFDFVVHGLVEQLLHLEKSSGLEAFLHALPVVIDNAGDGAEVLLVKRHGSSEERRGIT